MLHSFLIFFSCTLGTLDLLQRSGAATERPVAGREWRDRIGG